MANLAVEVANVSKSFRLYNERNQSFKETVLRRRRSSYEEFWALRDVSFGVRAGTTFGLVGQNGSGKSTMLKCITRILLPNRGQIVTRGSIASLLELGSGFHLDLSGRENVFLNASMLGISRAAIAKKLDAIIEFADIGEFIDQPVKTYSSGMYVRLAFAVATHVDPDILIVDEVLAVGDAMFQDRCMQKFAEFRRRGKTVILASHALGAMERMCDELGHLERGRLVDTGAPHDVVGAYLVAHGPKRPPAEPPPDARVRITEIEMIGAHGFQISRVQTGDPITFRMHYWAEDPIDKPVFTLALTTTSGVCAWAQHSRDEPMMPSSIHGRGSVDVDVPQMMLQAGAYGLHASIIDDALAYAYDFKPQGFCLEVFNDSLAESKGIAVLGGRWGNALNGSHLHPPVGDSR
ncbi:MAG TPA: ABC transporter ATP-binding protein [Jatrophihabitantaceae bacterium]|nr:ABC transporter ATP-binding protein [Jatrophihabitantaceae bacterium]